MNQTLPDDVDPDEWELEQARAAVANQGGGGRFAASGAETADDGEEDDETIQADEGEAVIQREAAEQYSPEELEAINDSALAPEIADAIERILASRRQPQRPSAPQRPMASAYARPRSPLATMG